MVYGDFSESEKQMFHLIWDRVKCFSEEQKIEWIPKVLKVIHLPVTDKCFLFFLLREFRHIQEASDLIMKAGEEIDVAETREWYLAHFLDGAYVNLYKCGEPTGSSELTCTKPIEVNGATSHQYSSCVLIKGFPFFVIVTSPNENETEYYVESPVAIEHLGLPYRVVVDITYVHLWYLTCTITVLWINVLSEKVAK